VGVPRKRGLGRSSTARGSIPVSALYSTWTAGRSFLHRQKTESALRGKRPLAQIDRHFISPPHQTRRADEPRAVGTQGTRHADHGSHKAAFGAPGQTAGLCVAMAVDTADRVHVLREMEVFRDSQKPWLFCEAARREKRVKGSPLWRTPRQSSHALETISNSRRKRSTEFSRSWHCPVGCPDGIERVRASRRMVRNGAVPCENPS